MGNSWYNHKIASHSPIITSLSERWRIVQLFLNQNGESEYPKLWQTAIIENDTVEKMNFKIASIYFRLLVNKYGDLDSNDEISMSISKPIMGPRNIFDAEYEIIDMKAQDLLEIISSWI
ncbi:MAG: hypothetical protein EOP45_07540 [Sphingobacteriaceae bacterium]|nr:MAG: hypothetical protein EOP45_07540 [Sphingobacteriaceae bacterium]